MTASSTASLSTIASVVAQATQIWTPHVRFDPDDRFWHLLGEFDGAQVWLLTWLPGQGTDLHDHGWSEASFTVVQGVLRETRKTEEGFVETRITSGDSLDVESGVVHAVANLGVDPAISIHAYSPYLEEMSSWGLPRWSGAPLDR